MSSGIHILCDPCHGSERRVALRWENGEAGNSPDIERGGIMMSGRRVLSVVGGAALALAVLTSTRTVPVAQATDYNKTGVWTDVIHVAGINKQACLDRAANAMRKENFNMWDGATGDTVQASRYTAEALIYCHAANPGVMALVSVHADDSDEAKQMANLIIGYLRI